MIGQSNSRACVFINSSNPSKPSQLINSQTPLIRPPFPPAINPHDLIVSTSSDSSSINNKKIRSRAPNAFIIYRKIFIETARSQGYYLPMTVISSMASQSWEQENENVKCEYRRLAKEAFNIHSELLPKTFAPRRRRREKWNIISFNSNSNSHVDTKKEELPGLFSWNSRSTTEPCIEQVTFPSPVLSSSDISSPDINNDITLKGTYNPALKLPPLLIPPDKKIHVENKTIKLPPIKPPISSKIQLLLNHDDE
jgi:hypothetical protein